MVRVVRTETLVQIWSKYKGKKALVASGTVGGPAPRGLRLFDTGNGFTHTSDYQVGCSPSRARVFDDAPGVLVAAFKDAGLTPPPIKVLRRTGPVYRALHAAHRVSHSLNKVLDLTRITGGGRPGRVKPIPR